MGLPQKGVLIGRAKIVSYTVGRGPVPRHIAILPHSVGRGPVPRHIAITPQAVGRGPVPRHAAMMPHSVGRGPVPRHACLPYPSIPKPIRLVRIIFNPPPVKPPFKFNDAHRRPKAVLQLFSRLLIARDKRVREIREPTENPSEGEFPPIFRRKECFRLWHSSPKEGGDEEETNQFFRIFV